MPSRYLGRGCCSHPASQADPQPRAPSPPLTQMPTLLLVPTCGVSLLPLGAPQSQDATSHQVSASQVNKVQVLCASFLASGKHVPLSHCKFLISKNILHPIITGQGTKRIHPPRGASSHEDHAAGDSMCRGQRKGPSQKSDSSFV